MQLEIQYTDQELEASLTSTEALQAECRHAVATWVKRSEPLLSRAGKTMRAPEVLFDLRGLTAGIAVVPRKPSATQKIRINLALLEKYPREMIDHTVPHEVAHLVTYILHGKLNHGVEWRETMAYFGKPATRCHKMKATPARRHKKFLYLCRCREHKVGPQINKRISRGAVYQCRHCSEPLRKAA